MLFDTDTKYNRNVPVVIRNRYRSPSSGSLYDNLTRSSSRKRQSIYEDFW